MTPQERLQIIRLSKAYVNAAVYLERNKQKYKRLAIPVKQQEKPVEAAKLELWNYLNTI